MAFVFRLGRFLSLVRRLGLRAALSVACVWLTSLVTSSGAAAEPRIELAEFRIEPLELRAGDSFTISASAVATDGKLGSFLLRTAEDVRKQDTIPGFPLYANNRYYVAENGRYHLFDNGTLDDDPREHAFAIRISTKGWKDGNYAFAFFASRRPAEGPFVAARHDFAVVLKGDRVQIEDLGPASLGRSRLITAIGVEPATIEPGEAVKVSIECRVGVVTAVELTNPFYIPKQETLPGFRYDATKRKSYYTAELDDASTGDTRELDRAADSIILQLETSGWPAGVHHFRLEATGCSGGTRDYRNFAVKVRGPDDRLEVSVDDSWFFTEGTHFGRFVKLSDGTLLCEEERFTDGGRTWQGANGGFGVGATQLRDGRVLGLDYRCLPKEGPAGWYAVERSFSTNGGRSFDKTEARVHVAEAKAARGHALHPGPLFMRSIVQRDDRSLVGLFAGWFKSDTALCPYGRGRPYSRTYVCESTDEGLNWSYVTTIGYAQIGSEGYNEGSMRRLPDGRLLVVMRTGNERDFHCQDNPIMSSESRDEGRTWSPPRRTGLEAAYPSLAVLSDGQLVMSYGRPGTMIAFSADGGRTWTDPTAVDTTAYSGYSDVVEIGSGRLLVGLVPRITSTQRPWRENQLRLRAVRYRRKR